MSDDKGTPDNVAPQEGSAGAPESLPASEPELGDPIPEPAPYSEPDLGSPIPGSSEGQGTAESAQPPFVPPVPPAGYPGAPYAPMPVTPAAKKTDALFFTLGFISAWLLLPALGALLGGVLSLVNDVTGVVATVFQAFFLLAQIGIFLAFLIVGRKRDNLKMRSFGKGGLWALALTPLLLLLAVGSCIVLLGPNFP